MVTIIWDVNGFFIVILLPEGCSYNSDYFIESILESLYSMKVQIWSETKKKKVMLHLDNSKIHNSKKSTQK